MLSSVTTPPPQPELNDNIYERNHLEYNELGREIKDPVHGYIPVSKLITSIIDTPQFQRLRYLKQLGTSYFVWPGASHNRFEHSLGVFNLASIMVNRLRKAQPALNITDRDIRCVEVAGLCHDLGHGPFSHVWDGTFIPFAIPDCKWKHEDASEMLLDYLVQDNNIDLKPDEVAFIKDLIMGSVRHTAGHNPKEKSFLFEIVANKRNGIDVDKFDYIARDTRAVSDGSNTDLNRLVMSARVIDGEICYSEKNAATVYGLFQERFKLHKTIYQHKTAKSIEYMVIDALIKADPYLKISQRIYKPRDFMYLNDDILNEIERSDKEELKEARNIVHRIRTRDLYRLVDKACLQWGEQHLWRQHLTPTRIVEAAKCMNIPELQSPDLGKLVAELSHEHVIVDHAELHHGMGDKFPLDNCKFYGKYNKDKAFSPRKEEDISHLLPKEFGEVLIRVFTRDARYFGVIQAATRALSESILMNASSATTEIQLGAITPKVPNTPLTATSSLSSMGTGIAADSLFISATTSRQTPDPIVPATPFRNNYTTVPVDFTPQSPTRMTRARKREADETMSSETPTKKKKKTN